MGGYTERRGRVQRGNLVVDLCWELIFGPQARSRLAQVERWTTAGPHHDHERAEGPRSEEHEPRAGRPPSGYEAPRAS